MIPHTPELMILLVVFILIAFPIIAFYMVVSLLIRKFWAGKDHK